MHFILCLCSVLHSFLETVTENMVDGRVVITFQLNRLDDVMYTILACRDCFKVRREHTQPLKFYPVTACLVGKAAFLRKPRVSKF
jgi:hypothetical protein